RGGGALLNATPLFRLISKPGPPGQVVSALGASGPMHSTLRSECLASAAPSAEPTVRATLARAASTLIARLGFITELPPTTSRFDDLPIESELVSPILAVERPQNVLRVGLDHAENLGFGLGDTISGELLIDDVALSGGDVDQDLLAVSHVLVQFLDVAAIARERELSCLWHREITGELQRVAHLLANAGALEARRRLAEPRFLLFQELDVVDVAQQLTIAERRLHDGPDPGIEVGASIADLEQELEEALLLILPRVLGEDLLQLFLDRGVPLVEASDGDDGGVV